MKSIKEKFRISGNSFNSPSEKPSTPKSSKSSIPTKDDATNNTTPLRSSRNASKSSNQQDMTPVKKSVAVGASITLGRSSSKSGAENITITSGSMTMKPPRPSRSHIPIPSFTSANSSPSLLGASKNQIPMEDVPEVSKSDLDNITTEVEELEKSLQVIDSEKQKLSVTFTELQKMVTVMQQENAKLKGKLTDSRRSLTSVLLDSENVLYEEIPNGTENNTIRVKGATVDKLIEMLYKQDEEARDYMDTFLMTFRAFTTAQYVLNYLSNEFTTQPLELSSSSDSLDSCNSNSRNSFLSTNSNGTSTSIITRSNSQQLIEKIKREQQFTHIQKTRLRIVVLLKRWVEEHYSDLDEELLLQYKEMIDQSLKDSESDQNEANLLKRILVILEKKLSHDEKDEAKIPKSDNKSTANGVPPPILPSNYSASMSFNDFGALSTFDPVEVARQMSVTEWNLFSRIAPKELLSLSWQKAGNEEKSPNVLTVINRFNRVSNFIAVGILKQSDVKKRAKILKFAIELASELAKLRNFNGFFEVASALMSSPLSRLQKTWNLLNPKNTKALGKSVRNCISCSQFLVLSRTVIS